MVGGRRLGGVFSNLKDAKLYEAQLVRERELIRKGMGAPEEKILVIHYAATWLEKRKQTHPQATWTADEKNLRLHILPFFSNRPLALITTMEWKGLLKFIGEKESLSPATINRIRSTAQTIYSDAIADGILTQNPVSAIPRNSEKKKTRKVDFWGTDAEILAYLQGAREIGPEFELFAAIALNTGARIGEITALQYCDVELDPTQLGGVIWIRKIYEKSSRTVVDRTKSGKDRFVPIPPKLFEHLVSYFSRRPAKKIADFLISVDGSKPINPERITVMHRTAIKKAGVKYITPHDLRRTYATKYRRDGGAKDDLQVILGHSSSVVTDIYAKTTKESVKKMALGGISANVESSVVVKLRGFQR